MSIRSLFNLLSLFSLFPLLAQDYTQLPDTAASEVGENWIGLSGTITVVGGGSFLLNYGDSTIAVGLAGDVLKAHTFEKGQQVTVLGKMDQDLFDRHILKARAVIVEGEEAAEHTVVGAKEEVQAITASNVPGPIVHGRVSSLGEGSFTLEQEEGPITIDTSALNVDPTGPDAEKRLAEGDLVLVQGTIRPDFFKGRKLKATAVDVIAPISPLNGEENAGTDRAPDEHQP